MTRWAPLLGLLFGAAWGLALALHAASRSVPLGLAFVLLASLPAVRLGSHRPRSTGERLIVFAGSLVMVLAGLFAFSAGAALAYLLR